MKKKGHEIRIKLTDTDMETYEKLKKDTGIKSDTELARFAFTKLLEYLNSLSKNRDK